MLCFRSPILVKITLLFFSTMLLYRPAVAVDSVLSQAPVNTQITTKILPVSYVDDIEFQRLSREYQRMGYLVKQGSPDQLRWILLASNSEPVVSPEQLQSDADKATEASTVSVENIDCKKPVDTNQSETNKPEGANQDSKGEANTTKPEVEGNNKPADNNKKPENKSGCDEATVVKDNGSQKTESTTSPEPMAVEMPQPISHPAPIPEPVPTPQPAIIVQPSVDVNVNVFNGGGGSHSDSAKVFFIITGIFVVAAFVVYVGKYISDIAHGGKYDLWWEVIFNNTFLDTDVRQHGRFNGVKIITGFNTSDLIQVALMGELGSADLNLIFDEDASPQILNFATTYWMLGATARLLLSNHQYNSNYLYMDLLGGKTNHGETDTIGAARMGFSFGFHDHLRLGVSYGAQYIGLNPNQGFVNNSGQYWYTLGVELGWRF